MEIESLPEHLRRYYEHLLSEFKANYDVATEVRRRTCSPTPEVEVLVANDMAGRIELLTGLEGVGDLIRSLRAEVGKDLLPFRLAERLLEEHEARDEQTLTKLIRVCLAVMTPPGTTAAPTEGVSAVRTKSNPDGTRHLSIYYANPIRSAGGTEVAGSVVLADYVRRLIGLGPYRPTEEEVMRFIEEVRTYRRKVGRFQFNVPDEALEFVLRRLPIEITGVPTDPIPVPSFREVFRVETPYLRGGALRVVHDGIVGRAKKVLKFVKVVGLDGWEWLEEVSDVARSAKSHPSITDEVIVGRPVLSLSGRFGGFRLRYGRAPNTSMSAVGVHPYTMRVLDDFVVAGTQLRLDFPGKAGVAMPVDCIEPPVVRLSDGSVIRVDSSERLEEALRFGERILFVGDLLVSFGDCVESNVKLRPPGYCEEWWIEEVKKAIDERGVELGDDSRWVKLADLDPFRNVPPVEVACRISRRLNVPMHPRFMPFWDNVSGTEIEALRRWLSSNIKRYKSMPFDGGAKGALESMLIPHRVSDGRILLENSWLKALIFLFRPFSPVDVSGMDLPQALSVLSGHSYRLRLGSVVGVRMGRPEKAAQRRMRPPSHVLFPVGLSGGPRRSLIEASKLEKVYLKLNMRVCQSCGQVVWKPRCDSCDLPTVVFSKCSNCGDEYLGYEETACQRCGAPLLTNSNHTVDLKSELESAMRQAGEMVEEVKGVRELISKFAVPEDLLKGVLRASQGLYVYKDGTIRFDATNAPLTHFRPEDVSVSVSRLHELGYERDWLKRPLVSEEQVCELLPQDVIIPKRMAEHLYRVSKFIDRYLQANGLRPFYNWKGPEECIGALVATLSPHTYGAVVCRVIGTTDVEVVYAHPFVHAAKRRDCDGDEDSVTLLMDFLINFSKLYLPDRVGGAMDSPLLITVLVDPVEVDEQSHNVDVATRYPLEFYEAALSSAKASNLLGSIRLIADKVASPEALYDNGFSAPSFLLSHSVTSTSYKKLERLLDKIEVQMRLAEKVMAVDPSLVAERVMEVHVLPDLVGNLRAFFMQKFICRRCNSKFVRPPLRGSCLVCGEPLSLTVYKGMVEKNVDLVLRLLERYVRDQMIREATLESLDVISQLFGSGTRSHDKGRQTSLKSFL
ncbi:MAG: DNA polymerase II large subunit [Thaumarchaeota archaeon]|nr:DNA polymerase II large subunit [Candidatus Calditenuaceae archaeon]MDW8186987.1 DNA polymerase II large subunit [Nitrososphaerota archaeon]